MNRTTVMRKRLRRLARAGVTLVEVMIVVAIMALIAGGVAFMVLPEMEKARKKTARTTALQIRQIATSYMALEGAGECPTVEKLIAEKKLDAAGGSKDPWGGAFTINCSSDDVAVSSPGPDRQEGSEDDIVVGGGAGEGG